MLFITLMTRKAGTQEELFAKREAWQPPEGLEIVAEYWVQASDPSYILISEADGIKPLMEAMGPWLDYYDYTVIPAVTREEGLRLLQQP